ncbi:MAG TPA: hypothetical protein DCG57_15110, partial [Candidatus Riflebacteria bacterium]|nr:hypothetical protein [Candidatus Riflebacteria bacterium]
MASAVRAAYPAGLPGARRPGDCADGFRVSAKKTGKKLLNNLREFFNLWITIQKSPYDYRGQLVREIVQT